MANMHIQQNNLSKQQFQLLLLKKTIIFVQANYNTNINITVNYD